MFLNKLSDSDSEATETQVWIDFAHDCGYLETDPHKRLVENYEELGRMLGGMIAKPDKFLRFDS